MVLGAKIDQASHGLIQLNAKNLYSMEVLQAEVLWASLLVCNHHPFDVFFSPSCI